MDDPKWKKFEKLATKIQQDLSPDAEVIHDVKLMGQDSQTQRQIDIVVKRSVGQFPLLVVMQCKDTRAKLDINVIGEFADVIRDVRANKGALVSSAGFTKSAITSAKQKGIDLFRLVDVGSQDWRGYASFPAAATIDGIDAYRLKMGNDINFPPERFSIPIKLLEDIPNLTLYKENGEAIGSVVDLIHKAWSDGKLPNTPGEHFDVVFVDDPVFLKTDGDMVPVSILVSIIVKRRHFSGNIPIAEMRGFQNVTTGGVYTRSLTTGKINIQMIEKEWQQIDDIENLAAKPFIIFHLV